MNREKIKLATNVPCQFTLENPTGKETSSRFHDGVEYMYSVICQGAPSILFLPVDGELAMKRLGAKAGDEVELTKTMHNNRAVFSARFAIPPSNLQPAPQPRQIPAAPATGVRMLAPRTQVAPEPAYVPQPAPTFAPMPSTPANEVHPLEQTMHRCFVIGGRALMHAWRDLQAEGIAYDTPTMEDLRAAGISLFIERTRK